LDLAYLPYNAEIGKSANAVAFGSGFGKFILSLLCVLSCHIYLQKHHSCPVNFG